MSDDTTRLLNWTVRDFPEELRKRVSLASQEARMTVSQWLEPIIDAALENGNGQTNMFVARASNRTNTDAAQDEVNDLCRLIRVASEFAAHRKHMQRDLAAIISRRLKQALLERQTGLSAAVKHVPKPTEPPSDSTPKQPELLQSRPVEQRKINEFASAP